MLDYEQNHCVRTHKKYSQQNNQLADVYKRQEGLFFKVSDGEKFFEGSLQVGNHIPLVYGDVYDEVVGFANLVGLEVIECA